tara:strand:- start:8869 stop:9051 length:183 start_codon:yes stop_codon:yes gene_type:complete
MIHQPWADDDIWLGCKVCAVGDLCYGLNDPNIEVKGTGKNFCISTRCKKIEKINCTIEES